MYIIVLLDSPNTSPFRTFFRASFLVPLAVCRFPSFSLFDLRKLDAHPSECSCRTLTSPLFLFRSPILIPELTRAIQLRFTGPHGSRIYSHSASPLKRRKAKGKYIATTTYKEVPAIPILVLQLHNSVDLCPRVPTITAVSTASNNWLTYIVGISPYSNIFLLRCHRCHVIHELLQA